MITLQHPRQGVLDRKQATKLVKIIKMAAVWALSDVMTLTIIILCMR
jgi:hypothetical protein